MTYVAVEKASVVVKRQSELVISGTLQQKHKEMRRYSLCTRSP